MRPVAEILPILGCPACEKPLAAENGSLVCGACGRRYQNRQGIWQFVENEAYTHSFGFQWQKHRKTQLDSHSGLPISANRFYGQTGWSPESLRGVEILEVGSGAGRFTEIMLKAGARVTSLELSDAILANAENNDHKNLGLVQASLFSQPFHGAVFDRLICFGVIQHTPDVRAAFFALFKHLKKGGQFCVDVYRSPIAYLHPRHLLRPLTRNLNAEQLYRVVEKWVPRLWPISHALHRLPAGELLARLVPVANFEKTLPFTSREQALEWSVLDTFDWYSPRFEQPQSPATIRQWCEGLGLTHYEIPASRGLLIVRGEK